MTGYAASRRRTALLLNLAIVVMELIGLFHTWRDLGARTFLFYTTDSNLFCLIGRLIFLTYVGKGKSAVPRGVHLLRYVSTCTVAVTFLVVVTILAPASHDYFSVLLGGSLLWLHTLCPLLSMISLIFFEGEPPLERRDELIALIPTALYAAVFVVLNLLRLVRGPYFFLLVYDQPLWMSALWLVLILGIALLLAWSIRKANNAVFRKL